MPVTLHHEDVDLLRLAYEGKWTWEEFYEGNQTVDDYLAKADNIVNLVIDLSNTNHLPSGALTHLRNIKHDRHPNYGKTIIVTNHFLLRSMAKMMSTLKPKLGERTQVASTREEAYRILDEPETQ